MRIKNKKLDLLLIFLSFHLIVWTLVPSISNINLPLDTIEALAWGSNLDWGYSKHPPLSALAVELFYQTFGNRDWAYYLLSQIFVIVAFYFVYKFSISFFNNKNLALISILLLEGVYFYNFTTPEFNVNIAQLPFWALSVYYSWRCFKFNKKIDFFILGIVLGLGVLSKYLFIYLIIGIKLFFLYVIITKKNKAKIGNYFITGSITTLILLPHILWLFENDFITINYAFQRTGGLGSIFDHFTFPIIFLLKQLSILLPLFFMIYFLIRKIKFKINLKDQKFIFLFYLILIPIILVFFTSAIIGIKIRTMWMTPFYLFFGAFIVYLFQKQIFMTNVKKFIFVFIFFLILSPTTYFIISKLDETKRTDYPGKEISRLVQNKWNNNFSNEIKVVIGDEWSAGNLSYHLNSRPRWIQNLKNNISKIRVNEGVIYTGNPKVLKKVCPGVFGEIKPIGYCMIGQK